MEMMTTIRASSNAMLEWFNRARFKNILMSGPTLQAEALEQGLTALAGKFSASIGWVIRLGTRGSIVFQAIREERVNIIKIDVANWTDLLPSFTEGYSPASVLT